jgi:hypothetical protein
VSERKPGIPKETISADDARALLLKERQERLQSFNTKMVALTQEYGCRVAPIVTLPGGEQVSLASFLQALGIEGEPGLQIVEVSE